MSGKISSLFLCSLLIANAFGGMVSNVGELSLSPDETEGPPDHIPQDVGEPGLSLSGGGGLADSPWPMFRQNLNHTGQSPYDTSGNDGQLKWSFRTGNPVFSSPAIGTDGTIYVGSIEGKLFAINSDGTEKWNFTTGFGLYSSPAIGSDGTIYVGSFDNKLYAINLDGTEKWNFTTSGWVHSSPAIGSDGTIYVGSADDKLYAIKPDGTEKWNFTTTADVDSSPAIGSDGTIYIGSEDNNLYAINPDGIKKWSFTTGSMVYSSSAIGSDGTIYVGCWINDHKLYAINPDGTEKWNFTTNAKLFSSPAIGSDGTIYVGSSDHKLYAIKPDGTEKWSFKTNQDVYSSPAIGSDGTIYFGSFDHKLYAINPDSTEKWNFTTGDWVQSSPAIGFDGTIYIGSRDGKLYAIGNPTSLEVEVTSHFSELNSAAQSTITVHVTDSTNSIQGATVTLSSDNGGLFSPQSGITDSNGNFECIFNAPTVTTEMICRITAEATKSGYASGSGSVDVTMKPIPWPMFRQNLNHTGLSPYDTSTNPGKLKWYFTTDSYIHSSAAIDSKGIIYIGSKDGRLYAMNLDGSQKWNFTTGRGVLSSPAIGSDGIIYVGSYDNKIYAINPDGTEKWNFTTSNSIYSSPAIGSDGTIYVGSQNHQLYAINSSGIEKWHIKTSGPVYSSPTIGFDGTIYIGSDDDKLHSINPDGTEKWNFSTGGDVISSPAIGSDGTIYIGSTDDKLYAINPDGTEKWSFSTGGNVDSSPAIGFDGTIYFGSNDNKLYALHHYGTEKWNFTTGLNIASSPAIGSDGTIYFGSYDSKLYAVHPNGTQKWNFTSGGNVVSSPTIASDGTIYFGSRDFKLYAIGEGITPPIANAGPDQTVDEGDTVQFDGSASYDPDGTIVSYEWDFGDGSPTGSGIAPTHIYSTPGNYTVTLTVTDDDNATDSDTCVITVLPAIIPPVADAGSDQTVDEGDVVQFKGCGSIGSSSNLPIDPDVVALWHMNEGCGDIIYDETANHNDGTISGALWDSGMFGSALSFDGVDDYVDAGNDISLNISDEITIEAWVYPKEYNWGRIVSKSQYPYYTYMLHFGAFDERFFKFRIGLTLLGSSPVDLNEWYHVVGTYDGTTMRIYINGNLSNSRLGPGKIPTNPSTHLFIGSDPNYWDNTYDKFNGTIDEVIIYNRALSAQEILDCYKSGKEHFVTGSSDSKEIISYEWDFESDGIYDYQETPNNAPDGTFDRKTTYIYGDNGIYTVTLRVTDETNATDTDTCNITVNNVDPIVQPTGDLTVDENSPFTLTIQTADIGSDDLTLTWNFGYGTPEITNTFYNDGTGPDPYPSPWGTFPFYTTDTQSHTYGDDGVFNVTLTVTDDDRGSIVYTIKVTVQNVDPTATIISTLMDVEIGIRVAGRKYNNVSMTLFEDGIQIGYVSIERQPGSPDEQMAWIPWVLDMTKTYSAIVTYEPEDPPNVGGNPVWIYIKLENGSIRKIHHTFNIQQSKNRDSDHWNHVDPWEVDLNVNLFGCPFEVTSHVTDPGSDDETLTFTYGSQTVSVTHLNNPPNPDPYPSPEISPVDITDTTALNYEGPGTIYLTVVDDDGGTDIATLDIT